MNGIADENASRQIGKQNLSYMTEEEGRQTFHRVVRGGWRVTLRKKIDLIYDAQSCPLGYSKSM